MSRLESADLNANDELAMGLAERVADRLRDMIVRGLFKPGERMLERSLCHMLGVSRTPMREALKLLHQDGLIDISRNRGARVAAYGVAEAEFLFEVIAALEATAAARFARIAPAPEMARLADLHQQMLDYNERRDLDAYFDTNSAIHDLIVEGAGNPTLTASHRRLMQRARRGRYMAIMDDNRWAQAVREHEALMGALRAGAADAAMSIWRTHLLNTAQSVVAALEAGDSGPLLSEQGDPAGTSQATAPFSG